MKWLCILLLVANALFAGWQVNERLYGAAPQAEPEANVPPLPADAPALMLLSESSEPPAPHGGTASETPIKDAPNDAHTATAKATVPAADSMTGVAATEPAALPAEGPATEAPVADNPLAATEPVQAPAEPVAEVDGPDPSTAAAGPGASDPSPAVVDTAAGDGARPAGGPTPATPADVGQSSPGPASGPESRPSTTSPAESVPSGPPANEATTDAVPDKPVLLCATIGPFTTRDAQRAAQRRLTPRVERIDGRSQVAREPKMFTVFLEPTGTEAEAEKRLDELKSKGITDYLLIRRGEMRNAIQVGTFRSQESVTKRMAELERSGYKAVVVPKSEAGAEKYWLDVVYDRDRQTLRSLKTLADGARAIRADCPR